ELIAQHLELRFLRQGNGLQHRFLLLLLRLVILDAEVEAAPAKEQIRRHELTLEKIEGRGKGLRIDEMLAGDVDDDSQRERRDVGRREHHRNDPALAPAPDAVVDVAHRHREHEAPRRSDGDRRSETRGPVIEEKAEVDRQPVSRPARGVQAPEERVAAGAQLRKRESEHGYRIPPRTIILRRNSQGKSTCKRTGKLLRKALREPFRGAFRAAAAAPAWAPGRSRIRPPSAIAVPPASPPAEPRSACRAP